MYKHATYNYRLSLLLRRQEKHAKKTNSFNHSGEFIDTAYPAKRENNATLVSPLSPVAIWHDYSVCVKAVMQWEDSLPSISQRTQFLDQLFKTTTINGAYASLFPQSKFTKGITQA